MSARETNATQRIGRVTWQLLHRGSLTTAQAAAIAEITSAGAWAMLCRLAGVLPVYFDGDVWRLVEDEPPTVAKRTASHG